MNDIFRWTVADIMQEDVLTVAPDVTVAELLELLEEHDVSGVPVVGPDDDVQGVVSVSDVARAVRDIMTPATFSVRPEATLAELARFLVQGGVHRALVLDGSTLAGIVTSMDVVRAVARAEVPA